MKELSLEHGVSEGLEERLDILLLTRAQSLTTQRNHTVLQRIQTTHRVELNLQLVFFGQNNSEVYLVAFMNRFTLG